MPARGLWAVQQTELARSASAQRPRAGIFRLIQSITFLLHISPPNLHFENFPTVIWDSSKFVWKRSRRDFVESKQQANIAGKRCLYTGIKTINGDRQCCPWALSSGSFDLLAPVSSFIRIWHDTMLLTWGFCMSKSFESSCEKPL